jgi:hypothetical protein
MSIIVSSSCRRNTEVLKHPNVVIEMVLNRSTEVVNCLGSQVHYLE